MTYEEEIEKLKKEYEDNSRDDLLQVILMYKDRLISSVRRNEEFSKELEELKMPTTRKAYQKCKGKYRVNIYKQREKCIKILDKVQTKAQTRKVDIADLISLAETTEQKLKELGLGQNYKKGIVIVFCEKVKCNSYKYPASSTAIKLLRGSKDWYLIDCSRESYWPSRNGQPNKKIIWPDETKKRISEILFNKEF